MKGGHAIAKKYRCSFAQRENLGGPVERGGSLYIRRGVLSEEKKSTRSLHLLPLPNRLLILQTQMRGNVPNVQLVQSLFGGGKKRGRVFFFIGSFGVGCVGS